MIAGSVRPLPVAKSASRTAEVGIQCVSLALVNSSVFALMTVASEAVKPIPAGGRMVGLGGLMRCEKSLREYVTCSRHFSVGWDCRSATEPELLLTRNLTWKPYLVAPGAQDVTICCRLTGTAVAGGAALPLPDVDGADVPPSPPLRDSWRVSSRNSESPSSSPVALSMSSIEHTAWLPADCCKCIRRTCVRGSVRGS